VRYARLHTINWLQTLCKIVLVVPYRTLVLVHSTGSIITLHNYYYRYLYYSSIGLCLRYVSYACLSLVHSAVSEYVYYRILFTYANMDRNYGTVQVPVLCSCEMCRGIHSGPAQDSKRRSASPACMIYMLYTVCLRK
jgi:hypothetical protein